MCLQPPAVHQNHLLELPILKRKTGSLLIILCWFWYSTSRLKDVCTTKGQNNAIQPDFRSTSSNLFSTSTLTEIGASQRDSSRFKNWNYNYFTRQKNEKKIRCTVTFASQSHTIWFHFLFRPRNKWIDETAASVGSDTEQCGLYLTWATTCLWWSKRPRGKIAKKARRLGARAIAG